MNGYPEPSRNVPAVCFDLDDTLAVGTWPEPHIGELIEPAADAVRHYYDEGYAVYIWTARPLSHHDLIAKWLETVGLHHFIYDIRCGKPLADLYVDDRSWRPPWVAQVETAGTNRIRAELALDPAGHEAAFIDWEAAQ